MTIKEIRALSAEQLEAKLKELKSELMNLRFQNSIKQLENTQRIVVVKKDIAKVLTVMNENKNK